MKKKNKINIFKIFLILLLIISLFLYAKLYIFKEKVEEKESTLPELITDIVWNEYDSLANMRFSSGNFQYTINKNKKSDNDGLSSCNRYYYDKESKKISFDCKNYSMKIVDFNKYKLVVDIIHNKKSREYVYYSSTDLIDYLIKNNISDITDKEIEKLMENKEFSTSDDYRDESYKNAQISKLSSIDELSIDEYLLLKKEEEKSVVLLINPNMKVTSYDLIPIFINWKDIYKDYNFYYINGFNLTVNDYDLLENDKALKDYLTGLYDNNILILENEEYKRMSIDIISEEYNKEEVFNCINNECNDVQIVIYNDEEKYNSIEEVLKK